ncbi:MAG: hypothetical protein D6721_05870 [Gammaproteobacteria bacterium]|nr:MAG: hypothetical protein D6721_05870 [Gammaproteobacteria bacterium]
MRVASKRVEGAVLVLVLWLLVFGMLGAAAVTYGVRTELHLAYNRMRLLEMAVVAHGEIRRRLYEHLTGTGQVPEVPADRRVLRTRAGYQVRLEISDEAGRVNLNRADPPLLRAAFVASGLSPDRARRLADQLLDWRDRDHLRHPEGMEDGDYLRLGRAYEAADRPLLDPRELLYLPAMEGVTPSALLARVTLFSGTGGINLRHATADLRAALQPPDARAVRLRAYFNGFSGRAVRILAEVSRQGGVVLRQEEVFELVPGAPGRLRWLERRTRLSAAPPPRAEEQPRAGE